MTAIATRGTITCESCGVPLTGGVDTFGEPGRSFCYLCFTSPANPDVAAKQDRTDFLNDRREKLKRRLQDAEDDKRDANRRIDDYEDRIFAIGRELTGGKSCDEENE